MINKKRNTRIIRALPFVLSFLLVISACNPKPTDTSSGEDTSSDFPSSTETSTSEPDIVYEDYYNDYYDSIESWEDGEDLRDQLETLVNYNVTLVNFGDSDNIWAVNQRADETLEYYDQVDIVYGSYQPLKTFTNSGTNGGWQREHAFAQSLGNFDVSNTRPAAESELVIKMRSDFHNVFASDGPLNGSRNNRNLGNVTEAMGTVYHPTDTYGNPSECRAIQGSEVNIFEPPAKDKAMLARGIFYMATRFADLDVIEGVAYVRNKNHGMLSDLLEWSENPVTRREYKHNIGVYHYQNNRNPYVDYPELVDYVFGSKKDESGELRTLRPSYYDVVLDGGQKEADGIHNLSIKNVKTSYEVGDPFSKANDLSVFTVQNDLNVNANLAIADFQTTYNDLYHFIDEDIGKKIVNVSYQTYNITYEIDIKSSASSQALYKYTLTTDDAFKDKTAQVTPYSIVLGGLNFEYYLQSGYVSRFQTSAGTGRQFGTGDNPIQSMYLETSQSFNVSQKNAVNGIYVVASTSKTPGSPVLDVSIGDYSFTQQTMIIGPSGENTLYSFELPSGESLEGKVRITFSGFTTGALYFKQFAINAI